MNKKWAILGLGILLGATTFTTVFASDVAPEEETPRYNFQFKQQIVFKSEEKLAEMAEEKGISIEEFKAEYGENGYSFRNGFKRKGMRMNGNGECLQDLAEEKGVNLEDLREQFLAENEAKHEQRLADLAEKLEMTVDELKQQQIEKRLEREELREQKHAEMAEQAGMTVEEFKEKIPGKRGMRHFNKGL
ncbi:hypothetical protein H1D32_17300 [Anaerobacillus sp. CMMVII]|uniref:hypothetical protein n=1 Tax=Anaerobacillus sp. CMMVII TaxID=2755588 RepID=UPI0021B79DB7|nr:hypothetical protein [Anaerobacillus sp. CMMVII]MCT8139307.1 hypothetical protein [Anaerobacillus sp. CMMVII]